MMKELATFFKKMKCWIFLMIYKFRYENEEATKEGLENEMSFNCD